MPLNDRLKRTGIARAFIALFGALWMLVACTPEDNMYSEFATMPHARWLYTDSLIFTPSGTADSLVSGTLLVAVRHTHGYRYQNLWLEVAMPQSVPGADSLPPLRDTLDIALADSFGRWLGRGSGASFMLTDTVARHFTLRKGAPVRVRHIMRLDTLPDIEQVGVVFIPD